MNENQSNWLVLWSQVAAGEPVDQQNMSKLRAAIESDQQLRRIILADRRADLLLNAHSQIDRIDLSEDEFASNVLNRLQEESIIPNPGSPPPLKPVATDSSTDGPFKINVAQRPKQRGKRKLRSNSYRIAGVICAAAVFLFLSSFAVYSWMNQHQDNISDGKGSNQNKKIHQQSIPPIQNAIAKLVKTENAVWQRARQLGDLIGQEELCLLKGDAQIEFIDGAIVNLSAPSVLKLNASDDIWLTQGQINAMVPTKAIGFKVQTPTTQIVDLGTEFDVIVDDIGETDVYVRTGKVDVCSNVLDHSDATWQLTAEDINRARFFQRLQSPQGPIAANVYGNSGQFQGMISVDGKVMRFDSSQAFDNVRRNVMQRFEQSPNETVQAWMDFVTTSQSASFSSGSVNVNGVEVEFNNMEEAIQLQQKIRDKLQKAISSGNSTNSVESFSATIVVNGEVRRFTSREEYEAAKKEIFGGAADFGAGMLGDK